MSENDKPRIVDALAGVSDLVLHALEGVEKALDLGGEPAARQMIVLLRELHNSKPWNGKP